MIVSSCKESAKWRYQISWRFQYWCFGRAKPHQDKEYATLWCDGLVCDAHVKPSRKKASNSDTDEATSTRTKRKKTQEFDDRVREIFGELKQAHSGKYTTMQLRIWAEMINSGMHLSTSDPPNTSMFNRAGPTNCCHSGPSKCSNHNYFYTFTNRTLLNQQSNQGDWPSFKAI